MQNLKFYTYAILLLAAIVTIVVGITSMDTFSLGAMGFLVWAISPYLFSAFVMNRSVLHVTVKLLFGLSLIIAIGGIYLLIDAMYLHPDAQGALAFAMIPMYQWGLLLITLVPVYFMYKDKE